MQDNPTSTAREVLGFKIESAIPIPPKKGRPGIGDHKKYPFDTLGVGESFFVTVPDTKAKTALSAQVAYWGKKLGWTFTRRTMDGGVRIWRIK